MKRKLPELPDRYQAFLQELKERIRSAQVRAALSVNRELVLLYWGIGKDILARQQAEKWGSKVVDRLARDLLEAFPGMTGFGARNLKYMRAFAEAYPDQKFVQQVVAQLPWGHNVRILEMVKAPEQRHWYIRHPCKSSVKEKHTWPGALARARTSRSRSSARIGASRLWSLPSQNLTSICCLGPARAFAED